MRTLAVALVTGLLLLPGTRSGAVPLKSPAEKRAEDLYEAFRGPWRADDDKSPLSSLLLHRYEKAASAPDDATWGVVLVFVDRGAEGYTGVPQKVEGDGDALTITLPPAGKGEKRGTRTLRLRKEGDRLKVRVIGGPFEETYELKRSPSKQ
jgi:hypothetical protein